MNFIADVSNHIKAVELKVDPIIIRVNKFDEDSAKEFVDLMSRAQNTGQSVIPVVIDSYGGLNTQLFEIEINKEEPWASPIGLSIPEADLKHGYIVLVDDVINSGKTMQYALIKFLQQATHSIKTLVLVDRQHRRYPIKADFVGLSLSTTLKNRVEVDLVSEEHYAYLT